MDQFKRILVRQKRDEWLKKYHKTLYESRISMINKATRRFVKIIRCSAKPYRHMWE